MKLLKSLKLWAFPVKDKQFARCEECKKTYHKSVMYYDKIWGWFCDEEEFMSHWNSMQV